MKLTEKKVIQSSTLKLGGSCPKRGHPLRSEEDFHLGRTQKRSGEVVWYQACNECYKIARKKWDAKHRERREAKTGVLEPELQRAMKNDKRWILFQNCDHQTVFAFPFPSRGDFVFCRRCQDYRIVERWGDVIRGGSCQRASSAGV